jgi:ribosome maturation factor RimP
MKERDYTLRDRLATLIEAMGYEFVGFELQKQNRYSMLRIFVDTENGVTVDDCTKVSRQVSAMLDVEDPIDGKYTLEVSSPGLDRPLFEIAHYQKFVGSQIKVRLYAPIEGRRNFVGVLLRVEEANISVLVEQSEIVLPFSNIEKAKLIPDFAK